MNGKLKEIYVKSKKETAGDYLDRVKKNLLNCSQEERDEIKRSIELEIEKGERKQKHRSLVVACAGIVLPMMFSLLVGTVALSQVGDLYKGQIYENNRVIFTLREEIKKDYYIEEGTTPEEKQKRRKEYINKADNKIVNNNETVKEVENEFGKTATKIYILFSIVLFITMVILGWQVIVNANEQNEVFYYRTVETALAEIEKLKPTKRKSKKK